MTKRTGLIPEIRKAEARVKVLRELLLRETGITEDEGIFLHEIRNKGWFDTWDVNKSVLWRNRERRRLTYDRLTRKGLIDVAQLYRRSKINRWGRAALARYLDQLREK